MKLRLLTLLSLLLAMAGAMAQSDPATTRGETETEQSRRMEAGIALLKAKRPGEAVTAHFDRIIAYYEEAYRDAPDRIYCARSTVETLHYLTNHARNDPARSARVVSIWCDALFLKAYAMVELRRLPEAKIALEAAVALSPGNAQYLNELGHVYQVERNWTKSIELFERAATAAQLPHEANRNVALCRAYRGIGFNLIELDELDEAVKQYEQCLAINPDDIPSRSQLEYIRRLRERRKTL